MRILVTGADGFMGRNLRVSLERLKACEVMTFDIANDVKSLPGILDRADVIVHLAGINRPQDPLQYITGNIGLTSEIADYLEKTGRSIPWIFSSSIQADLDNDYGKSKRAAEERLKSYAERTNACVRIFRFANVFGKWCRPNYNSVVATFCYNVAHNLPISIHDSSSSLRLIYIDDVVAAINREITTIGVNKGFNFVEAEPVYETTVGAVADIIRNLSDGRISGFLPNFSDPLVKKLNSTYLSYLDPKDIPVPATMKKDERGWLFELVKSTHGGQIFVSTTKPGKKRGNHFHDTKVEKFCVIRGKARISLKNVDNGEQYDFDVDGDLIRIIDIPPGYTHAIVNTGKEDCVTIFWANEIFDQSRPDTYFREV